MRFLRTLAVVVALALAGGTIAGAGPAPGTPPGGESSRWTWQAPVVASVSGFGDTTEVWHGSFLFAAVQRADGTVSGQVRWVDTELGGDVTAGKVTYMRVVGNKATIFAELPEGFTCVICGEIRPTHFFFVVVQGTGGRPDQVGWSLYFGDWGPDWPLEKIMALTPNQFIEWEANFEVDGVKLFDPPLLNLVGNIQVR